MSDNSQFKGLFDAVRDGESENQEVRKPESQPSASIVEQVPEKKANLCIKVPLSHRNHWIGSARSEGTTVTALITDFLREKYGLPGD